MVESKICFPLDQDSYNRLRDLLPHGTQGKLFASIAISLIEQIEKNQALILGGVLSGEIKINLTLERRKESDSEV